jgi:hypothetical protein
VLKTGPGHKSSRALKVGVQRKKGVALGLFLGDVSVTNVLPLSLQKGVIWSARDGERERERTPLFHLSQKALTPTSNPTPKAKAPMKMADTKTP